MIILSILTTLPIQFSLKGLENVLSETSARVRGLTDLQKKSRDLCGRTEPLEAPSPGLLTAPHTLSKNSNGRRESQPSRLTGLDKNCVQSSGASRISCQGSRFLSHMPDGQVWLQIFSLTIN